jgi:hypothetical protein
VFGVVSGHTPGLAGDAPDKYLVTSVKFFATKIYPNKSQPVGF